jgi:hypothetical protein
MADHGYPKFSNGSKNEYRLYCDLKASLVGTDALVFPESTIQPRSGGFPITPDAVVFFQGKVVLFDAKATLEDALDPSSAEEDEQAVKPEMVAGHFASGVIVVNKNAQNQMPQEIIDAIENISSQTRRSVILATRHNEPQDSRVLEFPNCLKVLFSESKPSKLSDLGREQLESLATRA